MNELVIYRIAFGISNHYNAIVTIGDDVSINYKGSATIGFGFSNVNIGDVTIGISDFKIWFDIAIHSSLLGLFLNTFYRDSSFYAYFCMILSIKNRKISIYP